MNHFAMLIQKMRLEILLASWVSGLPLVEEWAEEELKAYALAQKQRREGEETQALPDEFVKWFESRDA